MNRALLEWYEPRRDAYPWRRDADPYRVLVSEVMLQQTQAARVVPAFRSFLRRFPSVRSLAGASRADVLRVWGSLGYNRRAVALRDAARLIVDRHGGRVPADRSALQTLPGIGPYTSAAIAALAFGERVAAIDTNVGRVVSRARVGIDAAERREVEGAAAAWIDRADPGAWNQAVMDLGREVCRSRPRCDECPLRSACRFRAHGSIRGPRAGVQDRYAGSFRQVRGGVVRLLRARRSATVGTLVSELGESIDRVLAAIEILAAEGIVAAGPAARGGSLTGRVRLAD